MTLQNLKKPTRSSRNVVLAVLVLIFAVACYNWLVAPHSNYLRAAQRSEQTSGELIRKNKLISASVAAQKKQLVELREEYGRAETELFGFEGADEFFGSIDVVAEDAGCVVMSLVFRSAARQSGSARWRGFISPRRATLSVLAGYPNFVALIEKLRGRPERVLIDSISIKPSRSTPGQLDCDMDVTIYVMQHEETDADD